MNAREAIKMNLEMSDFVPKQILDDMTDEDLLKRPCAGCNHTNWQLGHLIVSENSLMEKSVPGSMPPLPAGFSDTYDRKNDKNDDPRFFLKKAQLLEIAQQQRAATLATLAKASDADLEKPTGFDFAPTLASMISMQGSHWMMHCGQWTVVRRQLGRPAKF